MLSSHNLTRHIIAIFLISTKRNNKATRYANCKGKHHIAQHTNTDLMPVAKRNKHDHAEEKLTKKQKTELWQEQLLEQICANPNTRAESIPQFISQLPPQVWSILQRRGTAKRQTAVDCVNIVAMGILSLQMHKDIAQDAALAALSYMCDRSPIHAMVLEDPAVTNESTARMKYLQVFQEIRLKATKTSCSRKKSFVSKQQSTESSSQQLQMDGESAIPLKKEVVPVDCGQLEQHGLDQTQTSTTVSGEAIWVTIVVE